jgi:heme-degrading monooxygenase HmoA
MYARISRVRGDSQAMEAGLAHVRDTLMVQLEQLPGFRDALLMIDREHGDALAMTLWDSEEAMHASEQRADALRTETATQMTATVASVERFEIVARTTATASA